MKKFEKRENTLVKICGLRRREDAEAANMVKPDLAGFILSPGFRRSIPIDKAQELRAVLSPSIRTVGVFVNAPVEEVLRAARSGCIDLVQLHGEETDEEIRAVEEETGLPVIKAFRIGSGQDLQAAAASAAGWILLDSGTGTGRTFDWDLLDSFLKEKAAEAAEEDLTPLPGACTGLPEPAGSGRPLFPGGHRWLLAGGLSAENAAAAIQRFHPTGVDVSSRVETDGWKDPDKMREFVEAVRRG